MRWNTVSQNWPAFVGPIMQRWPATEEEDLIGIAGDRPALERYIAASEGLSGPDAREQVAAWLEGEVPADVVMDPEMDNARIADSAAHIPPGEDVYAEDGDFGDDRVAAPPVGRDA